ncbi:LysR family transcriptional regulator [Pectobacterium versatile]|uniref:LysR family transcriptional regulator n=1 Tax=Pectobacterium versatile TaxID=2488639 RepID=UPI000D608816|nr:MULTISPECIES: LysR family transcriptional regulator [Pectobacterium]MBN3194864.1 LysR family transcriptional regulator [Pectobacterium versatile]MBQ4776726.1 LysR family transcriptional regulator [Pectobacterium versatile]MCL6336239.1 LysR family transcriptional regulator [Pectobacterium carotovorum subsp. carotovorum]MCL6349199.1 LysR family transcriptional regulator [Pectobacterium carotovorum subsp. carotovorum]MCL6403720.1 LysR family transcriptional regulator [Pectobacterium carotovoru
MKRNFNDLLSFVTVAREGSFTRAAAQLGVTQPALSQAITGLENRMQIRLLTRTTRSVSPTVAGERLLQAIGNRFDEIEAELDNLTELRDKPAGTVRITCGPNVLRTTLLPKLLPLLREYPDIKLEFDANHGFRNIVADRFDAGVRLGEAIDKDMIAVPIGQPLRMAAVASPDYFAKHPIPNTPHELTQHQCINQRMVTSGGLYVWDFDQDGGDLNVRVDGQLTFNTSEHIVEAALAGFGIAFLPEEEFSPHIEEGRLIRVLEPWCAPFSGYYLYYPSRKQPSPAFSLVVDALRESGSGYGG